MIKDNDTICALSTATGSGAIAIVRVSGPKAIELVNNLFSKDINAIPSHKAEFGRVIKEDKTLDEVVLIPFKNGKSYTGEDLIEINCHASFYITNELLKLLIKQGCRTANPGEFTQRAFLNGKLDLSQAEAVGDLIASKSAMSHDIAMKQMRGGVSNEIVELREKLLNFASLMELELDFGEEDVEFADRTQFKVLINDFQIKVDGLLKSFAYGDAIKNGIPVAIVGAPNAGKSTLLNRLLNEDKAIVSDIAGTTRDSIEDEVIIDGISFRFIDTAGLRETTDEIESAGIKRSYKKANEAKIILFLIEEKDDLNEIPNITSVFKNNIEDSENQIITIINKSDTLSNEGREFLNKNADILAISSKENINIDVLKSKLVKLVQDLKIDNNDVVISNIRHYESLSKAQEGVERIVEGLETDISSDLIAMDIRQVSLSLGEITGQISSDDILGNIFENFCIGK